MSNWNKLYNDLVIEKISVDYGYPHNCNNKKIISTYQDSILYHSTFIKMKVVDEYQLGMLNFFSIDNVKWYFNFKVLPLDIGNTLKFHSCIRHCLFNMKEYYDEDWFVENLNDLINVIDEVANILEIKEINLISCQKSITTIMDDKRFHFKSFTSNNVRKKDVKLQRVYLI